MCFFKKFRSYDARRRVFEVYGEPYGTYSLVVSDGERYIRWEKKIQKLRMRTIKNAKERNIENIVKKASNYSFVTNAFVINSSAIIFDSYMNNMFSSGTDNTFGIAFLLQLHFTLIFFCMSCMVVEPLSVLALQFFFCILLYTKNFVIFV